MKFPEVMIRRSFFAIDGGQFFPGYTSGRHWNGWAMPYFSKEDADRMCVKPSDPKNPGGPLMEYLPDKDAYRCLDEGEEESIFPGEICKLFDGGQIKLYPIGAGCWVWDEITLSCPQCKETFYPCQIGIKISEYPSGQIPRGVVGACPRCRINTTLDVI